ncbi:MAG: RNA polymerase sigma factor [Bryobacteraceae bacterium]|nr:RNA polymerase sigma factor [Bryobacteraceae bacterium]
MKPPAAQPFAAAGVNEDVTAVASLEHDAELMLRVRDGCNSSFAILLERHRGPVVHYMFRMVQNQAVAEELAQDVFLRVYRSRATYEPTAKFRTWLFRIATHLALNWLRDGKHERGQESLDEELGDGMTRQVPDGRPTVEDRMLRDSRFEEVRKAIQTLPEKQRAAVLMHKYQEMDYAAIAGVFECSESAVKSLLFRAYETLRTRLAHLEAGRAERERRQ